MSRRKSAKVAEVAESLPEPKPPEPPAEMVLGLRCAGCGCRHLFVVYVSQKLNSRVMRRRECRNCGKRITTWETVAGR